MFLIMLFLGVGSVEAASVYYVRAAAITGSNNGSDWSNAYTTLPGTLVRGATYYIAEGSYGSHTFDDAESATTYIYIKKATTTDHGPATDWQASYGDGRATFSSWTFTTGYYEIDGQTGGGPSNWDSGFGFEIVGSGTGGAGDRRIFFPAGYSLSNITVKHTEIHNINNDTAAGATFCSLIQSMNGTYTNITFSYCKIHHVYGCCIQNGYPGAKNWTVEYSKVGDVTGTSGGHSEIWSMNGVDNWTWRYNYIYAWRSTGCFYGTGPGADGTGDYQVEENWYIYGNIFDQAGTTASWLIAAHNNGTYDFHYAVGWRIYNNTFINVSSTANSVYVAADPPYSSNNEFKNNIFYGNTDTMTVTGWIEDYNSYQGSGQFLNGAHDSLLISSPFVNYSAGDYRLLNGMTGVALGAQYATDMFGNIRGSDGTWDRGAIEYISGSPAARPAAPLNLTIN